MLYSLSMYIWMFVCMRVCVNVVHELCRYITKWIYYYIDNLKTQHVWMISLDIYFTGCSHVYFCNAICTIRAFNSFYYRRFKCRWCQIGQFVSTSFRPALWTGTILLIYQNPGQVIGIGAVKHVSRATGDVSYAVLTPGSRKTFWKRIELQVVQFEFYMLS
jgi:hypothetical protein